MARSKKAVAAVAGSVLLGGVMAVGVTTPAHATNWIWVCNDSRSDDNIQVWRTQSPFSEAIIGQGNCVHFNDDGGAARVDVDLPGEGDIHKYRRSLNYGTFESWNCTDTSSSNPYSGFNAVTTYWTSIYYC